MITISKQKVRDTDVSEMKQYMVEHEKQYVDKPAGHSAYRLFVYLTNIKDGLKIGEIGSRNGSSAIAFSLNPKNEVHAYEIDNNYFKTVEKHACQRKNVKAFSHNVLTDDHIQECLQYDIIFLDITPHDGPPEKKLIDYLCVNEWEGILILDDIGEEWPALVELWDNLEFPKFDLTDIAHHAGTGIVDFSGKNLEVVD